MDSIRRFRARYGLLLGILLLLGTTSGCSPGAASTAGRPPVSTVVGTVTHQGQPVRNAVVQFHPQGEGDRGTGHTDDNGEFKISTYGPQDGAVVGLHAVTVQPLPEGPAVPGVASPASGRSVPEVYLDPAKTPLTVEVKETGNTFSLQLK